MYFMSKFLIACSIIVAAVAVVRADDPTKSDDHKITSATYLITGLHCPPCTKVVEGSLSKAPGVRSIKVDWSTKDAKIDFDETVVTAERIAQLIAATPHMMGPSMHYDSWLALKTPEVKDDATAKAAKEALGKVAGVKKAEAFPAQHVVEVQFAPDGKATSAQLIAALASVGIKAQNY
jgi:copper chaperone CopZ